MWSEIFESVRKILKLDLTFLIWGFMTGVRSCYDEGKRTAETLNMDYHRGAGLEVSFFFFFFNLLN